ncbi:MAG TPA: type II toxin-antitoxin system VapC family toxin [Candidatus Bathyarchaeia archaeon]|nr:type II toxin-antitoxin system VapC family toxin [Candidatus Bathyarchaeia archaeon]
MTVLIDSWTWIEYWRGGPHSAQAAKYVEGSEMALASTVNITETFFWVLRHYGEEKAGEKRETLRKRCFLVSVDEAIAVEAARLKHSLKTSLADSVILATARSRDAKVVTGDPDFKKIPDAIYIGE